MIGIIGAMDVEVELLVSKLQNKKEKKIANYNFYSGTIENKEVVVIKSGIGKVASSVGAGLMIEEYHPDFIINTGIAGGINGLHTADILIADSLRYSDVDAVNFGYKLGQVPGMPLDYLTDVKIKEKIQQILKDNNISFKNGKIYTADIFVTDLKQINIELENVCACEMEGTSIAQACYLLDTKFVSIRFISDIVGTEEQVKDYGTFEKLMANKSANICFDIVSKIK